MRKEHYLPANDIVGICVRETTPSSSKWQACQRDGSKEGLGQLHIRWSDSHVLYLSDSQEKNLSAQFCRKDGCKWLKEDLYTDILVSALLECLKPSAVHYRSWTRPMPLATAIRSGIESRQLDCIGQKVENHDSIKHPSLFTNLQAEIVSPQVRISMHTPCLPSRNPGCLPGKIAECRI